MATATAASVQSPAEINVQHSDLHQTNKESVISDRVVENSWIELPSRGIEELSSSQHLRLNSTTISSALCDSDCTSDVVALSGDLPSDASLLRDGEWPVERPPFLYDINELPVRPSAAVLHVEDYLLSDSDEAAGHGLTNGWTNVDNDEVHVLRQTDVSTHFTTKDSSQVPKNLQHVTDVSDVLRSLDLSAPINDISPTKLVASQETVQTDLVLDETLTSSRYNGLCHNVDDRCVCVNGHVQSTTSDADDSCHVCGRCDDLPLRVRIDDLCDVNSNVTSLTDVVITVSGDDDELDEFESREEECRRVAQQLSAAWTNTVQHTCTELLENYGHIEGDLTPPSSPTTTTRHIQVDLQCR